MTGKKSRSRLESFKNAFAGIRAVSAREKNFRIQIYIAVAAVIFCIIFRVTTWHFVLVAFAIFFVLATELINTAVEAIVDLITGGRTHPLAKIAKDAAAGAVLLASVFALTAGAYVVTDVIRRFM